MTQIAPPVYVRSVNLELPVYEERPVWSKAEVQCLADVIYGEARGEPLEGQIAVGIVVINRSMSPKYSANLCRVVYQKNQFAPIHSRTGLIRAQAVITHYGSITNLKHCLFFHSGKKTAKMFGAKYVTTIGHHHFY